MGTTVTKATKAAIKATKKAAGKVEEGQWQEDGACHEEEGCRHFRTEEAQRVFGGHLRGQDHAAYRGDEEDLGLHQEELAQPGSHHQAGCEVEGHLPGCEP